MVSIGSVGGNGTRELELRNAVNEEVRLEMKREIHGFGKKLDRVKDEREKELDRIKYEHKMEWTRPFLCDRPYIIFDSFASRLTVLLFSIVCTENSLCNIWTSHLA